MTGTSLKGVCVLVTRPEALGGPLAQLVSEAGGDPIRQPAVEIVRLGDLDGVRKRLAAEGVFDIAVFVSVNAVNFGLEVLPPEKDGKPLLAAIGPATRRALEEARRCDICSDTGYTSEALLAEPAFAQVEGQRIVIVRGKGGRELLFEALDQRGAVVHIAEVYERRAPAAMPEAVVQRLAAGNIDLVTATSVEILHNVLSSVDGEAAAALLNCQLVTASPRVVQKAAELGFKHAAILADAPDDGALLAAMQAWNEKRLQTDKPRKQSGPAPQQESLMSKTKATGKAGAEQQALLPAATGQRATEPAGTAQSKPRRGGLALGALALLLALLAGALAGYTWWQQKSLMAELQAVNDATTAEAQALVASLQANLVAVEERVAIAEQLRKAQARLSDGIDDNAGAIDRLSGRIQGTEAAIDNLRGVSATVRQAWILAQAEYFMVTANDSLQLAGNPSVALAALQNADARLQELGDPGLTATRAALAREIAALRAMPAPDIEGIVHELGSLAARIDQLPMANELPSQFGSDTEREATGDSAWSRARSVVASAVRDTISIRRTTADDKPMLAPEEVFFLRRNIELQLEVARLAALRGEPAVFSESLRSARRWLSNWFDQDNSSVASAVDSLTRLESQDIKPALPDISASLRALRAAPTSRGDGG